MLREHGFTSLRPEDELRATVLLRALNDEQLESLRQLAEVRTAYYHDVKDFMARQAEVTLASGDSDEDMVLDISLATSDLLLRALSKWTLAVAEIVAFGEPQGGVPMETERIIKMDDIDYD